MAEQINLVKKDSLGFLYVDHSDKTLIWQHMNKDFVVEASINFFFLIDYYNFFFLCTLHGGLEHFFFQIDAQKAGFLCAAGLYNFKYVGS